MTEIIDVANAIAEIKENIRTAINERGISVDTTIPLSQYPQKITEIARDPAFYARNDLGVTEIESGTKVLIQPLEQQSGLVVAFTNALQKENWGALCLYPSSNTRFMCDNGTYSGGCGLYSWNEEQGLEVIYNTTDELSSSNYSMYYMGVKYFSPKLIHRFYYDGNTSGNYQYYWTESEVKRGNQYEYIYNDGLGVKSATSSNWTLWKVDENGEFTEQIGQDVTGANLGQYYDNIYVSPDGKYVVSMYSFYIWENTDGALTRRSSQESNLQSIVNNKNYNKTLGGTYDGKYIIVNRYNNSADENGCHNFPAIIQVSDDYKTFTEVTDFAITGLPTWYPWLQTLLVKNALGVVRMFKYENGEWNEKTLDFPNEFTNGSDNRVTLNYDGSQICVADSVNFNTGAVYLYNLEVTPNGYKAIPLTPYNFNTKCYTAYATGNINVENGTVEVNALLPSLDNITYTPSV